MNGFYFSDSGERNTIYIAVAFMRQLICFLLRDKSRRYKKFYDITFSFILNILIFLFLLSCKKTSTEANIPDYVVWGVMKSTGEAVEQYIYVDRVYSPDERAGEGLHGADVKIRFLNNEFILKEKMANDEEGNKYLIYADTFEVPADIKCTLKVNFPDSKSLLAVTEVPGAFNIIYPQNNDTINVPSNELLLWTKSKNAKFYVIYLKNPLDSFITLFSPDTFLDLFRREGLFNMEGEYTIYLFAENEDLYKWNLKRESNYKRDDITGVFAAYVERELKIYIKK